MKTNVFFKHTTFYTFKGITRVYTTISNTDYHKFLRSHHNGKTYKHEQGAKLYFMYPDFPLDAPIPEGERVA